MKRVDQTILAGDPVRMGNCVSACIASIFSLRLDAVPHFVEFGLDQGDEAGGVGGVSNGNAWWAMLVGFLAGLGWETVELDSVNHARPDEFLLVAGMSSRGLLHQVIYFGGELWHDPHPSREGVLDVREVLALRPLIGFDHTPTAPPPRLKVACINWSHPGAPHALVYMLKHGEAVGGRFFPTWDEACSYARDIAADPRRWPPR